MLAAQPSRRPLRRPSSLTQQASPLQTSGDSSSLALQATRAIRREPLQPPRRLCQGRKAKATTYPWTARLEPTTVHRQSPGPSCMCRVAHPCPVVTGAVFPAPSDPEHIGQARSCGHPSRPGTPERSGRDAQSSYEVAFTMSSAPPRIEKLPLTRPVTRLIEVTSGGTGGPSAPAG